MYYITNNQRLFTKFNNRRGLLFVGIIIGLLFVTPVIATNDEAPSPRLQGTFIQLLSHHGDWTKSDWHELFDYFSALQLSGVVIQWSVIDDIAFYPSSHYSHLLKHPLEIVLELADEHNIDVFVGLAYDTQYWAKVGNEPQALEVYFNNFYERSSLAASEMLPLVTKYSSFKGWYISEEIDDINWRSAESQQVLFHYLEKLTKHLRTLTPDKRVALSGFSNGALTPDNFQLFWSALLVSADVDTVLFQDGIGVNKLQFDNLHHYLEAMRNAALATGTELQAIIETFTQIAGTPIDNQPFQAIPAPLERILQQVSVAAQYAEKNIAFSIPEYMTPKGGGKAEQLYKRYTEEFLNSREVPKP